MVQQQVDSLTGTNGYILRTILRNPDFHTLHQPPAGGGNVWQVMLDLALRLPQVRAVIDSGALAVGASNLDVAKYLLQRMDTEVFLGVLFYDAQLCGWAVLDAQGCIQRKELSPVRERDCFAFFDESRARGSDLKLNQESRAVVTVGPGMTSAKLMQAAFRMRLLHAGQTLCFVATEEITMKIVQLMVQSDPEHALWDDILKLRRANTTGSALTARATHQLLVQMPQWSSLSLNDVNRSCRKLSKRSAPSEMSFRSCVTSADLVRWVVLNTIQANRDALIEWAQQGAVYATTSTAESVLLDEAFDLESMYGHALVEQKASFVINRHLDKFVARAAALGEVPERMQLLLSGIRARAEIFGTEFEVIKTAYEEEYECAQRSELKPWV